MTAPTIRLIDPDLPEFGNAGPAIAGGHADDLSRIVANDEPQTLAIMTSGRITVVLVEPNFDRIELVRR